MDLPEIRIVVEPSTLPGWSLVWKWHWRVQVFTTKYVILPRSMRGKNQDSPEALAYKKEHGQWWGTREYGYARDEETAREQARAGAAKLCEEHIKRAQAEAAHLAATTIETVTCKDGL